MDITLYDWTAAAAEELELPDQTRWVADRETVSWALDLAREIARGVARPAAPVGTFLAGVAIGLAGADDPQLLADVRARLTQALSMPIDNDV